MHPSGAGNVAFSSPPWYNRSTRNGGISCTSRVSKSYLETNGSSPQASGLNIVGAMLGKSDFKKRCDRRKVDPKRSQPQIKDGDILLTYIGLLALGKTSYDSVHEFDDDPDYFQNALGIARENPSAETVRQRMDDIGDSLRSNLLDANVDLATSSFLLNYGHHLPKKFPHSCNPDIFYP